MSANTLIAAPCRLLTWDSDFFGFPVGRVEGDTLCEELGLEIDDWSQSTGIRCLYFLSRADCPATLRIAEKMGFGLADVRMTFDRKSVSPENPTECPDSSSIAIRQARSADLSTLEAMARSSHKDTRFFTDSNFPPAKAEALYAAWIRRDCQSRAESVFVAVSAQDEPLGYISCYAKTASAVSQIGLVGVKTESRGHGVGRSLVEKALRWFEGQGAKRVEVVTQGRNVPAQRLYQACGFSTCNVQFWYHKWYPTRAR